jgi:hypothetical protein
MVGVAYEHFGGGDSLAVANLQRGLAIGDRPYGSAFHPGNLGVGHADVSLVRDVLRDPVGGDQLDKDRVGVAGVIELNGRRIDDQPTGVGFGMMEYSENGNRTI